MMYTTVIAAWRTGCVGLIAALVFAGVAQGQCVGDCSGDNDVTINEIILGVTVALGTAPLDSCPSFDVDGNGDVTVNEIIAAVLNALNGCTATPTGTPLPTTTPTGDPNLPTVTPTDTPINNPSNTSTVMPPTPTITPTAPAHLPTATPTASATATAGAALCGNGVIEAGESCDDGNTVTNPPTDTCPADCTIIRCSTSGTKRIVSVSFAPPAGKSVASLTVLLEYPDGTVQIPGSGSADSVQAVVINTPSGTLPISFDYDYAVKVSVAGTTATTPGKLFDVNFSDCKSVTAPPASAFKCTVITATAPDLSPVTGVTCSVTVP